MLRSKWVMLCPMARTGSSHTCELLDAHDGVHCHHGLFNEGPFGRWPADKFLPPEKRGYYSSLLDKNYVRIGGEERSGEFLDEFIFTDDPRFNLGWSCVGLKIQFVHFVHMPDLLDYLLANEDVKIIVNTRRHLLEHAAAEQWCQRGNSRAARPGDEYDFGNTGAATVDPKDLVATFRNLCRYRQFAVDLFDDGTRAFFEWSYEDIFRADGSLDVDGHRRLFDFLEIEPSRPFAAPFARTPRPDARSYFTNFDALREAVGAEHDGVFAKYFDEDYDPRRDPTWPVLEDYRLDEIMVERDNLAFRA
jgi:hypothetical protein